MSVLYNVALVMSNTHIYSAPIDELAPHILRYWKMGKPDTQTLELLRSKHINLENYGLGYALFLPH